MKTIFFLCFITFLPACTARAETSSDWLSILVKKQEVRKGIYEEQYYEEIAQVKTKDGYSTTGGDCRVGLFAGGVLLKVDGRDEASFRTPWGYRHSPSSPQQRFDRFTASVPKSEIEPSYGDYHNACGDRIKTVGVDYTLTFEGSAVTFVEQMRCGAFGLLKKTHVQVCRFP
jgi:hypothetical protein